MPSSDEEGLALKVYLGRILLLIGSESLWAYSLPWLACTSPPRRRSGAAVSGSVGLSPWEEVCPTRCCSARWPLAGAWQRGPRQKRYPSGHPGALSWFPHFPSHPPSHPARHLRSPAQGPSEKQHPGSEINTAANRKAPGQNACPCPCRSRVTFIWSQLSHFHYSTK